MTRMRSISNANDYWYSLDTHYSQIRPPAPEKSDRRWVAPGKKSE
jgi:hypothetical protein